MEMVTEWKKKKSFNGIMVGINASHASDGSSIPAWNIFDLINY
jgi:hypothetical protein